MATIVISGMMVPIICSFLPLNVDKIKARKGHETGVMARMITAGADFSMGRGKYVVGFIVGALIVLGISQTTKLKVGDPSPGTPILWPDHSYNQDQGLINRIFKTSSDNLVLYYEGAPGSVYDPQVLVTFEKFDTYMAKTLPDIYKSSSSIIIHTFPLRSCVVSLRNPCTSEGHFSCESRPLAIQ